MRKGEREEGSREEGEEEEEVGVRDKPREIWEFGVRSLNP